MTDGAHPVAAAQPELGLGVLAVIVTGAGYVLLALSEAPGAAARPLVLLRRASSACYVVAHLAVRRFAPRADAHAAPARRALLNGIGFVTISRLDSRAPTSVLAPTQAVWTAVGVAAFVVTLLLVRDVRILERYRYTFLLLGVVALLLPLRSRHRP